jgi:hypothetical protein
LNKIDLSTTFDSLKYGEKYDVCVVLKPPNTRSSGCDLYCSAEPNLWSSHCKRIETRCELLPKPSKIPHQISWSVEDSFNPFTDVKFEMSDGTFDGQLSGLYTIKIRSYFLISNISYANSVMIVDTRNYFEYYFCLK